MTDYERIAAAIEHLDEIFREQPPAQERRVSVKTGYHYVALHKRAIVGWEASRFNTKKEIEI